MGFARHDPRLLDAGRLKGRNHQMRLPAQRIDSYTQPVSGRVASHVRIAVERELRKAVPGVERDALFEVSAEPRGTYTGVTILVQHANSDSVIAAAERIENELDAEEVRTLINVRTRS